MTSKNILIISLVTVALFIASLAMILFICLRKDDAGSDVPVDPDTGEVVNYDDYSDANKKVFVTCIQSIINAGDDNEHLESWKKNMIEKSLYNLADAIQQSGVSIDVFYELSEYFYRLPTRLNEISSDVFGVIEDDKLSLGDISDILTEVNHLEGFIKLIEELFETGITDDNIANTVWYFIKGELPIIKEHSTDIMFALNTESDEESVILMEGLKVLIIQLLPNIDTFLDGVSQEAFVEDTKEIIDYVRTIVNDIRGFPILKFSKLIDGIAKSEYSEQDIISYFTALKKSLEDQVDANGKYLDYSDKTQPALSALLKVALLPDILKEVGRIYRDDPTAFYSEGFKTNFDNIEDLAMRFAMIFVRVEDITNLYLKGLYNLSEFFLSDANILVRDKYGNIIGSKGITRAFMDNIVEIYDGKVYHANNDTLIIASKILSYVFSSNGIDSVVISNMVYEISNTYLDLVDEFFGLDENHETKGIKVGYIRYTVGSYSEQTDIYVKTESQGTAEAFASTMLILMETFERAADFINEALPIISQYGRLDLGATQEEVEDISSSASIYLDVINNIFDMIANDKFVKTEDALMWLVSAGALYISDKYRDMYSIEIEEGSFEWYIDLFFGSGTGRKVPLKDAGMYNLNEFVFGLNAQIIAIETCKIAIEFITDALNMDLADVMEYVKTDPDGKFRELFGEETYYYVVQNNIFALAYEFDAYRILFTRVTNVISYPLMQVFRKIAYTNWSVDVDVPEYVTNIFDTK